MQAPPIDIESEAQRTSRLSEADLLRSSAFHRFLHRNGLSIVVLILFLITFIAQVLTGLSVYNQESQEHGQPKITVRQYLLTGHFFEATGENWESEFLQMAAFVWLTSFLFQKGSPESNDPDEPEADAPLTKSSPWPARQGGWVRAIYANSLALMFLLLFFVSMIVHAAGGAVQFSKEQVEMGQRAVGFWEYLTTSQFWFESFQNWQSEFLSIAAMVIFAIFLRQKGSAESKPVNAPHSAHE